MDLTIQEKVELCRKDYFEQVKPRIIKGRYQLAALQLGNIIIELSKNKADLFYKVHWGVNYLSSAQMLEKTLQNAKTEKDIGNAVELFEADQAQTKLPLIH